MNTFTPNYAPNMNLFRYGSIFVLFLFSGYFQSLSAEETRSIDSGKIQAIFYDSADTVPYDYTLEDWPEEGKKGILAALAILDETLVLSKVMTIGFMWSKDVDTDHAIALSYNDYIELEHLPGCQLDADYKYPRELLNQMAETDKYGGENISIIFNSLKNWCFSSVEEPLPNQQDLITVTLHELSHGLGMSSSYTKANDSEPYIFDKYMVDKEFNRIVDANYLLDEDRDKVLTSGHVYFEGPEAMKAHDNKHLKLHSPATLTSASLCHLDLEYEGNPEGDLMIPGTRYGQSTRYLGSYIAAILKDVGWTTKSGMPTGLSVITDELENVLLHSNNDRIYIDNQQLEKISVSIYTVSGQLLVHETVSGSVSYSVTPQNIYIVRINNKAFKIKL